MSDDLVAPADDALQTLLTTMALNAEKVERRDQLLDWSVAVAPLADWPTQALQELQTTCEYVISLARLGRELRHLNGTDGEWHAC